MHERSRGLHTHSENLRVAGFYLLLGLSVYQAIPEGSTVVSRPLKYSQMGNLFGNLSNELDTGGTSANYPNTLSSQIYSLFRPGTRVTRSPSKAIDTFKIRDVTGRKTSDRRDQEPAM